MKPHSGLLVVTVLGFAIATTRVKADVLIDTGKGGTSDAVSLEGTSPGHKGYQDLAGKFTTGTGVFINSVKGWMNTYSPGQLNVVIRGDNNGIPSDSLMTKQFSLSKVDDFRWLTFSGLDFQLEAGTYWIAFEPVDNSSFYALMPSGAPHPLADYAYLQNNNGGWHSFSQLQTPGSLGFKIIGKADETVGMIDLDVDYLNQGDGPWAIDHYDNSYSKKNPNIPLTIANVGCGLTALTMAINYIGTDLGIKFDPGSLNESMNMHALDFVTGNVNWVPATKDASGNQLQFNYRRINSTEKPNDAKQYLIDVLENQSLPVIVNVGGVHFVLVTGHQGDQFQISDPGHKDINTLDHYSSYETRGYVSVVSDPHSTRIARRHTLAEPTGVDQTGLYVAASENVSLQIIDPSGNTTGVDFSSGTSAENIPASVAFTDAEDDNVTGEAGVGMTHFVYIDQAVNGNYQINVQGKMPGAYTLASSSVSSNGTLQSPMIINGTANVGKVDTYSTTITGSTITRSTVTLVSAGDGMAIDGGKKGKVIVQRTGDLSSDLTVLYKVKGTAMPGVDYEMLPGSITIPAGSSKAKIKVKPIIGSPNRGDFTVKLAVKPAIDGSYNIGSPKKTVVQLLEGD